MKTTRAHRPWLAAFATAGALLSGCVAQPKPLYYWGSYQPELYVYFKKEASPEGQLAKLEETAAKAQSENLALPPGFRAHMGLLYLQMGQLGKAEVAFQAEKARFPESAAYMDFLLKTRKPGTAVGTLRRATAKPVVAKPTVTKAPVKGATAKPGTKPAFEVVKPTAAPAAKTTTAAAPRAAK